MKCKKCKCEHDGSFGSGRFCSRACANSRVFSEQSKKKKSDANKKRVRENGKWGAMLTPNTDESIKKCKRTWKKKLLLSNFESLNEWAKRKRVIIEQEYRCHKCKLDEWMSEPIALEIEHLNGEHTDNRRENLIALCPNCHSLSVTWRGRNKSKKHGNLSDKEILDIYKRKGNIRQTLLEMGFAAKGDNYAKIKRILDRYIRV